MADSEESGSISSNVPGEFMTRSRKPISVADLLARNGLIAISYIIAGYVGLTLASAHDNATLIWAPTGIALASVALYGYRVAPGVAIGAFVVNLLIGSPVLTCVAIAAGNTLESVAGVWMLRRAGFDRRLERVRDVTALLLLGAGVGAAISAFVGVTSLSVSGIIPVREFAEGWAIWWLGDALGAIVIAPLLLTWGQKSRRRNGEGGPIEAFLLFGSLVACGLLAHGGLVSIELGRIGLYAVFPLVLWAAIRFGLRATTTAIVTAWVIGIVGVVGGVGSFASESLRTSLLVLVGFTGLLAVTAMFLAAAVSERRRAEGALLVRASRQAALASLGQRALQGASLQVLMDEAVGMLRQCLRVDFAKVLELQSDGKSLLMRAGEGWVAGLVGVGTVEADLQSQAGYTLISHRVIVVTDLRTETRFNGPALLRDHGVISGMSAIIPAEGRPFGVLGVHTIRRREFSEDEVSFLATTANVLADAMHRRRSEAAVRESESRYRTLTEAAADGIFIVNASGSFLAVNPSGSEMLGYTSREMIGRNLSDFTPAEDLARTTLRLAELASGKTMLFERQLVKRDGGIIPVEVSATRLPDGNLQGIVRDVSVRKETEQALRESEARLLQAQKMEAVGRLAGGIAHDFNNLLTVILGYCRQLSEGIEDGSKEQRGLDEIGRSAERAADLTRQLLAYSRKQVMTQRVIDLRSVVVEMHELLRRVIGEHIRLSLVEGEGVWQVKADPGQIQQVILNLAVNASDAMPDGGRLDIRIANVNLENKTNTRSGTLPPGEYVTLSVADSGHGMNPEALKMIFEPFFTTKTDGKGTGLGLSTVYGIVMQSGGQIEVESTEGAGSTFRVFLPRVEEPAETVEGNTEPAVEKKGAERILLVEDESSVRELLCEVLSCSGYEVTDAPDGSAALRIVAEHDGEFDLLVTDMVMPGMGGRELAEHLTGSRPDLKVLFMSGYTEEDIMRHVTPDSGNAFIQKPFTPTQLTSKIREILEGARKAELSPA